MSTTLNHPHAGGAWRLVLRAGSAFFVAAAALAALGFAFNPNYFTNPTRGRGVAGVLISTPTPAEAAATETAKTEAAEIAAAAKLPPQATKPVVVGGKTIAVQLRVDTSSVTNDIAVIGDVTDYYRPGLTVVVGKITGGVVGATFPVPYGESCTNIIIFPPIKGEIDTVELYRVTDQRAFSQWLADRDES